MAKNVRQHYVPQSYLRRFTEDGEKLYVYDKFERKNFGPIKVVNVAQERYFYDISLEGSQDSGANPAPHLEERALSELESAFNNVIATAIAFVRGDGPALTLDEIQTMSLCVAVQLMRTRTYRNVLTQAMRKLTEASLNSALKLAKPALAEQLRVVTKEYSREEEAALHGRHMWNLDLVASVAAVLNRYIWFYGVNTSEMRFYTSDTPVVIRTTREKAEFAPRPDIGPAFERAIDIVVELNAPHWNAKGAQIIFPLNSEHALILSERSHFQFWEKRDSERLPLGVADVRSYNELQVMQSYRQVYCSTRDFDIADAICNAQPEVCSPDQERVQVNTWEWNS
jgi:hypothetical protein